MALTHLECERCASKLAPDVVRQRCRCGGTLFCRYDMLAGLETWRARRPGPWRYRELLPLIGEPVSLGETETPLVGLVRLSERWGAEAWLKDDGLLPTGTFKARGAAVGVSVALELGVTRVVIPTVGNAGGAWALYAARAGIEITVVMPESASPANRAEVELAGGNLILTRGSLADAGRVAADVARQQDAFLAATFGEPYRLEGKKTAWLEVFDRLDFRPPRTIVVPVGGGVGLVAAWKAMTELSELGWTADGRPKLVGVQAAECAPIARAFEKSEPVRPWVGEPSTAALGLRVPAPSEGDLVLRLADEMLAVSEEEIVHAMRDLASLEGLWACPEGAAAVAGAARLAAAGRLEGPAVVYNTGAGAKYAGTQPSS